MSIICFCRFIVITIFLFYTYDRHITEKQLCDLGLSIREKLIISQPCSFYNSRNNNNNNTTTTSNNNSNVNAQYLDRYNSIATTASTQLVINPTLMLTQLNDSNHTNNNNNNNNNNNTTENTMANPKLFTTLNAKSFKIQNIVTPNTHTPSATTSNNYSIPTATPTIIPSSESLNITMNTTTNSINKDSNITHNSSAATSDINTNAITTNITNTSTTSTNTTTTTIKNKSRKHKKHQQPVFLKEVSHCPEFIHFGRCSIYNKCNYCPYIHSSNFHKIILYPPKRCPTCTLILPCFHCPYSFLQKELYELCQLIYNKKNILEKLIDNTTKEIIVLTTVENDIPFSTPVKRNININIIQESSDDINITTQLNRSINNNDTTTNKSSERPHTTNNRNKGSSSKNDSNSTTGTPAKTKRQVHILL